MRASESLMGNKKNDEFCFIGALINTFDSSILVRRMEALNGIRIFF